jgi:hypothetical protein
VLADFLGDVRPAVWVSDRYGAQMGWCACRKLDPYVLVMQSTQDRTGEYATNGLDGARNGPER